MGIQNTPFRQWKRRGSYFLLSPLFPLSLFTPPWPCFPSTCPAEWESMCSTDRGWGGGGVEKRQKESQIKVVKRSRKGKVEGEREGGKGAQKTKGEWLTRYPATEQEGTGTESEREGEGEKMRIYMRWPVLWDKAGCCHFKNDCNKSDRQKMDLVILAC